MHYGYLDREHNMMNKQLQTDHCYANHDFLTKLLEFMISNSISDELINKQIQIHNENIEAIARSAIAKFLCGPIWVKLGLAQHYPKIDQINRLATDYLQSIVDYESIDKQKREYEHEHEHTKPRDVVDWIPELIGMCIYKPMKSHEFDEADNPANEGDYILNQQEFEHPDAV